MRTGRMKKMIAIALSAAMALSLASTSPKSEAASTAVRTVNDASTDAENLIELMKGNLLENTDISKYGQIASVESEKTQDVDVFLRNYARDMKSKKGKSTMAAYYDIDRDGINEVFTFYPSGVRSAISIGAFDRTKIVVKTIKNLAAASEVRTNKSKKQITVCQTNSAYSYTFTVYKLNGGKLKKVNTYKRTKKTYKKNGKKIKKKAFKKFVKAYNKLPAIKEKKITGDYEDEVVETGISILEDGLYRSRYTYPVGSTTTVFSKETGEGVTDQNKCVGYEIESSNEDGGEGQLLRYVFGPDVMNTAVGRTYQEIDWLGRLYDQFDGGLICNYLTSEHGTDGKRELFIGKDEITDLKVETGMPATNGDSPKYSETVYTFKYGDVLLQMSFFADGDLEGRIHSVVAHYSGNTLSDVADYSCIYYYGEAAKDESDGQLYDPYVAAKILNMQSVMAEPFATRTLKVNDKAKDTSLAYDITTANNVRFALSTHSGQFYVLREDGSKLIVAPYEYNDSTDAEYDMFDAALNLNNVDTGFTDPVFETGLFWEAV